MYAIYARYATFNSDGYHVSFEVPTFYVNADCEASAVKIAREILWAGRDDKYEYYVSACEI